MQRKELDKILPFYNIATETLNLSSQNISDKRIIEENRLLNEEHFTQSRNRFFTIKSNVKKRFEEKFGESIKNRK